MAVRHGGLQAREPRFRKLGFFTRLLDPADPAARYRTALDQIRAAEALGFDAAWIAQHHVDGHEGGMPSPFVFLAAAAGETSRIRLGTGILTLALDHPVRAAEDAAVLDILSGGRLELGLGTGGSGRAFTAFGLDGARRGEIFGRNVATFVNALGGAPLPGGAAIYPAVPSLRARIWQATFSAAGGARAGQSGDGLMLSRTQPRPENDPDARLETLQQPIVDAYLAALPPGVAPRIMASRSVFVADDRGEALRLAEAGLKRFAARLEAAGQARPWLSRGSLADTIRAADLHIGTPDEVIASLASDPILAQATELSVQVHPVDPPPALVLRSIELMAREVAPAFGWSAEALEPARRVA